MSEANVENGDIAQPSSSGVPKQTTEKFNSSTPWIENYRPQTFKEIVGNDDVVKYLETFSINGNAPNIILSVVIIDNLTPWISETENDFEIKCILCMPIVNDQKELIDVTQIINKALSPADYRNVIKIVENSILSTELTMYFKKKNRFMELVENGKFDWQSEEKKELLQSMLNDLAIF